MRDVPKEWKYGLVNIIAIFSRFDHGFGSINEFSCIYHFGWNFECLKWAKIKRIGYGNAVT